MTDRKWDHVSVNMLGDDVDDELFLWYGVDQRKALSLISSWDHCQRSSPSRISDTRGFEPAQNLSSGLIE